MSTSRDIAADILLKMEVDGAYSSISVNDALKKSKFENVKDVSLVTALVYGVCERKLTLDYNLQLYLKNSIRKLHPAVLTYLRLGAYQILFSDKIPDRAAINESVELTKKNKPFAASLVNAVLRRISENGLKLPEEGDFSYRLSVKYSCTEDLIKHFLSAYGENRTVEILDVFTGRRPLFIRVNTLKISQDQLIQSLRDCGIDTRKTDRENCLVVENTGNITELLQYKNGEFFVQDKSAQMVCDVLDAQPGDTVIDCCAAPGGKSFSIAINMKDKGKILSCDIYPHKTELIDKGAERLGIKCISTVCTDARKLKITVGKADRVLCDVPCSGLGVMGRKPEIKYKDISEVKSLPELQLDILENCAETVRIGGVLVYSTCTLNPDENQNLCDLFLEKHIEFELCDCGLYKKYSGEENI